MAIRIKQKTYGPFTTAIGAGKIVRVATAARQTVSITSPASEEAASPVDFLVSALGACLALSFHHAAQEMGLDVGTVSVDATAQTAADLPNRVGSYAVTVSLDIVPEAAQCEELIRRAKARCTVSNSLNGTVEMRMAD